MLNILTRVQEDLKNHKYTNLVLNDNVEVWRCAEPKTSIFAFDIMITRYGIAVVGDIGDITFRVGKDYGIPFLAGRDIEYYICSKLNKNCIQHEFNEKYFYEILNKAVSEWIYENLDEDKYWKSKEDEQESDELDLLYEETCSQQTKLSFIENNIECFPLQKRLNLLSCLEELSYKELDATSATEWLMENEEVLGLSDCWEYNLEKTSENTLFQLHMINHAAKEIMKIKEKNNEERL